MVAKPVTKVAHPDSAATLSDIMFLDNGDGSPDITMIESLSVKRSPGIAVETEVHSVLPFTNSPEISGNK